MRRLTVLSALIILMLSSLPAQAGKIGFIDAERAIAEVEEGKKKFAALQAWQEPHQEKLDGLRDQVVALREQLAEETTPEARAEIERNEISATRAFEDARREYERLLETKKHEFLSEIAAKIALVGTDYAKKNEFDAVFLLSGQPMMFVAETANITDIVIGLYNERFPISID
jgi:Skp family chaperone for outer membrane proteins